MIVSGPSANCSRSNHHPLPAMPAISERSTKAEILAALRDLEASTSQGPTWEQVATKVIDTSVIVWRETKALVIDTYRAGSIARQWVDGIIAELSRPVLRS